MRLATFILASHIAFLTFQPMAISALSYSPNQIQKSNCCERDESKPLPKQNSNEEQCPGICNPFGQGTCCLYLAPTSEHEFIFSIAVSDYNSLTSANLLSNYLADCFHPPEVI